MVKHMAFKFRNFFIFFIFIFFIFIKVLKFIIKWLKINHKKNKAILNELKIYLETIVMLCISIMSICISISANKLTKQQVELSNKQYHIDNSPYFYLQKSREYNKTDDMMEYYKYNYLHYTNKGYLVLKLFEDFNFRIFYTPSLYEILRTDNIFPFQKIEKINHLNEINNIYDYDYDYETDLIEEYSNRFYQYCTRGHEVFEITNSGSIVYNCTYLPFSTATVIDYQKNQYFFIIDNYFYTGQKTTIQHEDKIIIKSKAEYFINNALDYLKFEEGIFDNQFVIYDIFIENFIIIKYEDVEGIERIELYAIDDFYEKMEKIDTPINKLFPNFRNEDRIYFDEPVYKLSDFYNGKLKEGILDSID